MTEITRQIRAVVMERDDWQCQGCGVAVAGRWHSIQHRVARGTGGGNGADNLVLLCGSATSPGCHRRCEDRDPEMRDRGLWLRSWDDPARVPVIRFDGTARWLLPSGTVSLDDPFREGEPPG
jgi:hypothetical protein